MIQSSPTGYFNDLLHLVLPDEREVVLLAAYLDASQLSRVFCVAAVAFGRDRAIKAEREWVSLYGHRRGHMTDLHARQGDFKGISEKEADALCRGSISIIDRYASFVIAISCHVPEISEQLPQSTNNNEWMFQSSRGVFPCCLHWTMGAVGAVVGHQRNGIVYFIESGDDFYRSAAAYLAQITNPFAKDLQDLYALAGSHFLPKDKARLFECADMVAWEWATHISRLDAGNQKRRRSLIALMHNDLCTVNGEPFVSAADRFANHYSGEPVKRYMAALQRIIDASSAEEIEILIREAGGE